MTEDTISIEMPVVVETTPKKKRAYRTRKVRNIACQLVNIGSYIPQKLDKKLDAFIVNLNARSNRKVAKREVIMIAIATLIKGEHLMEEYYKVKGITIPARLKPKIAKRKSQLNAIIDSAMQQAVIRSAANEDGFNVEDLGR